MSARRASRKICRAVSRSTRRMGAPQRGHGHDGAWRGGDERFGGRRWRDGERLTTLGQLAGARARGEEAEVADADEALRQHVQEEAAEKLVDVERERAHLTAVPIVLPPKRDGVVGDVDEPVVGDGDAVGVAREVVEDVRRAAEGRLRVRRPTAADRGIAATRERRRQGRARRGRRESRGGPAPAPRAARRSVSRERPAAGPSPGGRRSGGRGSTVSRRATSRQRARRSGRGDDAGVAAPTCAGP